MNEFVFFLKCLVVLISIYTYFSFKSNKHEAEQVAEENANTSEAIRQLTSEEIHAVNSVYQIQLQNHDLVLLEGELSIEILTNSPGGIDRLYKINGARVMLPSEAIELAQEYNIAQCVYHDKQLYIVTFNDYCVLDHEALNQEKQANATQIQEATVGKLGGYQLEVLGKRDTTPAEMELLDINPGLTLYIVVLVCMGILATLLIVSGYIWGGGLTCLVSALLVYWWLKKKLTLKQPRTVTKMRGVIDQLQSPVEEGGYWFATFQNEKANGHLTYRVPEAMAAALETKQSYMFELDKATNSLVSVTPGYSLDRAARTTPKKRDFHLGLAVGWGIAVIVMLQGMPLPDIKISALNLLHPVAITMNSTADLSRTQLSPGMKVHMNGYRQCEASKSSLGEGPINQFCQQFTYVDQPLMNYEANPFKSKFSQVIDDYSTLILYPKMNRLAYMQLQLYARLNGDSIQSWHNVVDYFPRHVYPLVLFVERYCSQQMDNCSAAKRDLEDLWIKMTGEKCTESCWPAMVKAANNPQSLPDLEDVVMQRWSAQDQIRGITLFMEKIYEQVLAEYSAYLNDFNGDNRVTLIANGPQVSSYLDESLGALGGTDHVSVKEVIPYLNKLSSYIAEEQKLTDLTGYVVEDTQVNGQRHLTINVSLTPTDIMNSYLMLAMLLSSIGLVLYHSLVYWRHVRRPDMVSTLRS